MREFGQRPSTSMTNAELKEEVDYLIEQVRKDRLERGLPEEGPEDFVPLAMAWTMYERCDPLYQFVIEYAQLCDKANEVLPLSEEKVEWAKSFRKYTDLISRVKDASMFNVLGGSLGGLIKVIEKHGEYEAVIELLRPLMLHFGFLKGEYHAPSLHQFIHLPDDSKDENDSYREEVYAEIERLKDEEYFSKELERLSEYYESIKHLY